MKRYLSLSLVIILILTLLPIGGLQKVKAYQNSAYFNNLDIGLTSMSNTAISINLNGAYTINDQTYPSGSVLNLKLSGTSIDYNGVLSNSISFSPKDNSCLLAITSGTTVNKYMGSFTMKVLNGKIVPINNIDMENYLKGVVGYEMSDYYPLEALKAQAIAARNYALARVDSESGKGYDFDDTIAYQVYKGFNASYKNVIRAVDETKGQVLLYNDKLVDTLYSAWHGGYTEDSMNVWGNSVPYLKSMPDSFENDPWPNGNRTFTIADIQSNLVSKGYLTTSETFIQLDLNSISKYTSGRVSNINIIYKDSTGVTRVKSITKDKTRTFLSLPSNMYNVVYDSVTKTYTFSGKGYGHGLGMSQIGAKNRAAAGQTFEQILKFYYQNSYIQNLVVKASFSNVSQSSDKVFLGEDVAFNASGSLGNGYGYLYKYIIKNGSTVVYTSDYSSVSSLSYNASSPGCYSVEVYVKDKYSNSDYDDRRDLSFIVLPKAILTSFSTDKVEGIVGQGIAVNLEAQGGSNNYLYKYTVTKNSTIILTRDYMTDKQFIFTPQDSGVFTITAYMKDSLSSKEYDSVQSQEVIAYSAPSVTSIIKNIENPFTGDIINFDGNVTGGSSRGLYYKYTVSRNDNTLLTTDFINSSSFSYMPDASGNYEVVVYVKDALSDQPYDSVCKLAFKVKDRAAITSFTGSKTRLFQNEKLQLSASSNNEGSLYRFVILKDSSPVYSGLYSTSASFDFVPELSGNYEAQIYVKDSQSLRDYDSMQSLPFSVLGYAEISSFTKNKTEILKNQEISFFTSASKGSGSYLYKYSIEKDTTTLFSTSYSQSGSFSYTPDLDGKYTVKVFVKDEMSPKEYDASTSLDFSVLNDAALSNIETSKSRLLIGQSAMINAAAMFGSGSYSYKFVVMKGLEVVNTGEYSSNSRFEFSPASIGDFNINIYVKDRLSSKEYDDMKIMNIKAFDAPAVTLTSSSQEVLIDTPVQFSLSTKGGSGNAQYKFIVMKDSTLIYDSGYTASDKASFTPTLWGSYRVIAYARDALSENGYDSLASLDLKVNYPTIKLNTASINASKALVGDNMIICASAPAGSLYKYVVSYENNILFTREFSSDDSFTYSPSTSGTYKIEVYAKHYQSANEFDDMKTLSCEVYAVPGISSYNIDKSNILTGQTASFVAEASNGSGEYLFRYTVSMGTAVIASTGYTANGSFTFSPSTSGDYQISVYMKDALSKREYDSTRYIILKVYDKPQLSNVTASGYFYEGKNADFAAKVIFGSPSGLNFKYEVYKSGTLILKNDYSSSNTFTLVAPSYGQYTVRVYAKDILSVSQYDSVKEITINVLAKPLYLSKLPISYGMTSNDVTSLQNALIKLGYLNTGATGYFGTATKSAVIAFQSSCSLSADGIVGSMTYNALNERLISNEGVKSYNYKIIN